MNLVKWKRIYPYQYLGYFENFEERLPCKDKCYSSFTRIRINAETVNMFLKFGINLMKARTDSLDLYFKYNVFPVS